MAIYSFEERIPSIGKGSYVFDTASVIGDVEIGEDVFIGAGAIVRGDYGRIVIGDRTSVEENVVIHSRPDGLTTIGKDVTLGHGCVIHNCSIEDMAVIGMGAVVSDHSQVGRWGFVAEGAVVRSGSSVEEETIVAGIPAVFKKRIDEGLKKTWIGFKSNYPDLAGRYPRGLKRIDDRDD
jgi:carbonic anhydrase/acetyltransferase-like protein (isoleucine patch superfamily)